MTQGTKIGLLVSLAFLIVICVLLSDHVVSTSDAKPAMVTAAGSQVAQGISTPGIQMPVLPEPIAPLGSVAPLGPVQTAQEMIAPPPAVIAIGPGQSPEREIRSANNSVPTSLRITAPADIAPGASIRVLADLAAADNQAVRDNFVSPVRPVADTLAMTPPAAPAAPKSLDHKAQPGDTVAKMARKHYGLDTKSNRDLIIAANRSLKANPNKIEVGKVYVVPVKPGTVSAVTAAAAIAQAPVAAVAPSSGPAPLVAAIPATVASPAPVTDLSYVVKSGDNLWKIATQQCKDAGAVDQIRKMNRDVLKNSTDLKVGTKLRLPAPKAR